MKLSATVPFVLLYRISGSMVAGDIADCWYENLKFYSAKEGKRHQPNSSLQQASFLALLEKSVLVLVDGLTS